MTAAAARIPADGGSQPTIQRIVVPILRRHCDHAGAEAARRLTRGNLVEQRGQAEVVERLGVGTGFVVPGQVPASGQLLVPVLLVPVTGGFEAALQPGDDRRVDCACKPPGNWTSGRGQLPGADPAGEHDDGAVRITEVAGAAGGAPCQRALTGAGQCPTWSVLEPMVRLAQGGEIVQAGCSPNSPRRDVVQVAPACGDVAAGVSAGGIACAGQIAQGGRRPAAGAADIDNGSTEWVGDQAPPGPACGESPGGSRRDRCGAGTDAPHPASRAGSSSPAGRGPGPRGQGDQ